MALLTTNSSQSSSGRVSTPGAKKAPGFAEAQKLARIRALEKVSKKRSVKLDDLTVFTQQLAAMLDAGLSLVTALESLQEQTQDPVFAVIIREVKNDVATGTSFSAACRKFPKAFPNLFVSMVEAGEASGAMSPILAKVATYFEDAVKLSRQVKGALIYPIVVLSLAVVLINVMMIFVIPIFAAFFTEMGKDLPMPTKILISLSGGIQKWWWLGLLIGFLIYYIGGNFLATPKGRIIRDRAYLRIPVVGNLVQKVACSRFCRTYGILMRSGVPILRSLEIVSAASDNTFIEDACKDFIRAISQGSMLSEVVPNHPFFPPIVKNMVKAGEQTGNIDSMLDRIADFFDSEIEVIVAALTKLMEPVLIVFLGVVIGGMVTAMFLPIFQLASAAKG